MLCSEGAARILASTASRTLSVSDLPESWIRQGMARTHRVSRKRPGDPVLDTSAARPLVALLEPRARMEKSHHSDSAAALDMSSFCAFLKGEWLNSGLLGLRCLILRIGLALLLYLFRYCTLLVVPQSTPNAKPGGRGLCLRFPSAYGALGVTLTTRPKGCSEGQGGAGSGTRLSTGQLPLQPAALQATM